MATYCVNLPERASISAQPGKEDAASIGVLRLFHPVLLSECTPLCVIGDGKCFFRALFRGLFGDETSHLLVRMLTAMEVIDHRQYYDTEHANYCDLINDNGASHDSYRQLLKDVTQPGGYAEMVLIYAASAALKLCVQSYSPPAMTGEFVADSLTRRVRGRSVRAATAPAMTVMWTMMFVPKTLCQFRPNQFVVLHRKRQEFCDLKGSSSKEETSLKFSNHTRERLIESLPV